MKNKLWVIIIFLSLICFAAKNIPLRPDSVPSDAKWNENFKYWSIDGEYGSFKIWYEKGSLKIDQIITGKKYMKELGYFENGIIRMIGQNTLLENKFKKDNKRFEWRAYGKWKEFNKEGHLLNEVCYTQIFDDDEGVWNAEYCGEEINYNEDGTVKERIKHKLECKYGCEELECEDCIKK